MVAAESLLNASTAELEDGGTVTMSEDELEYRFATSSNAEDVYSFLLNHFRTSEPITTSLGATEDDLRDFFRDLKDGGLQEKSPSILVYHNEDLIAVCLNDLKTSKKDPNRTYSLEIDPYKDYAKMIASGPYPQHVANQLWAFITTAEENLPIMIPENSLIIKLDILCVRKDFQGRGIAKKLVQMTLQKAEDLHCNYVCTVGSAVASQGIFKKYGFKSLCEMPFFCFRENGKQVYENLSDGGLCGRLMAYKVPERLQNGIADHHQENQEHPGDDQNEEDLK
ncbi:hypothetical protein WR25_01767 [Diploscapter pachys]|uniref:aralkylamine N-acetyltransferase n=1 Tax=Diploscapter pachys TaxID=2018661 RepID=A0A2A2JIC7_9BILA|nr:hypothetical protein WR25_01767 [Diploscapter pachys]